MAEETLLPDSTITTGQWTRENGSSSDLHLSVDDVVDLHDADETYIKVEIGTNNEVDCRLGVQNPTVAAPYTRVRVRCVARFLGFTEAQLGLLLVRDGQIEGQEKFALTSQWTTFEFAVTGSWSQSQANDFEIGFRQYVVSSEIRVTATELVVSNATEPTYSEMPPPQEWAVLPRRVELVVPY